MGPALNDCRASVGSEVACRWWACGPSSEERLPTLRQIPEERLSQSEVKICHSKRTEGGRGGGECISLALCKRQTDTRVAIKKQKPNQTKTTPLPGQALPFQASPPGSSEKGFTRNSLFPTFHLDRVLARSSSSSPHLRAGALPNPHPVSTAGIPNQGSPQLRKRSWAAHCAPRVRSGRDPR